jgi:hypothetical protein
MAVTASILIDFGAGTSDAYLTAELDSEMNNGKTTFSAGDNVYFRVYTDAASYAVTQTSGSTQKTAAGETESMSEVLPYAKQTTASATKKVKSITSMTWYGTDLGALSIAGAALVKAANATTSTIGVGKAAYVTEYDLWKLTPPSGMPDEYAILILITVA